MGITHPVFCSRQPYRLLKKRDSLNPRRQDLQRTEGSLSGGFPVLSQLLPMNKQMASCSLSKLAAPLREGKEEVLKAGRAGCGSEGWAQARFLRN